MNKRNIEAWQLFREFLSQDELPSPSEYILRCPEEQKATLIHAFNILNQVMEFYMKNPEVSSERVDTLEKQINAIRRKENLINVHISTGRDLLDILFEDAKSFIKMNKAKFADSVQVMCEALNIHDRTTANILQRGGKKVVSRPDEIWLKAKEQQVEEIAQAILKNMPNKAFVDPFELANFRKILVIEDYTVSDVMGQCICGEDLSGIILNKNIDKLRLRFTFAHEIGHSVLHRRENQVYADKEGQLRDFSMNVEHEANIFASCLLMPVNKITRFYKPEDMPRFRMMHEISETMSVSKLAALYRIVRLSEHPVAMVVSHKGIVQWSVESSYFEGYIRNNIGLPESSSKRLLFFGSDNKNVFSDLGIDINMWVSNSDSYSVIDEYSYKANQDYIYTLLIQKN